VQPAVAGGSITVPPACTVAGGDRALTAAASVRDFAWLWHGDRYLVVFSDEATGAGDIYVGQWRADGTLRDAPRLVEGTAQPSSRPSIAPRGDGFVVAWEEDASPHAVRVHALDGWGHPTGSGANVAYSLAPEVRPMVSPSPHGVAITWTGLAGGVQSVQLAELDASLALTEAPRRLGSDSGAATFSWLAGDATSLAVLWSDSRTGKLDTRLARLDPQMAVTTEVPLRSAPNHARLGRVIKTGFGHLSAWEDNRTGRDEIYMALTDGGGAMMNELRVEEPGTSDAHGPNLAWTGKAAGIVYYQLRQLAPQIYLSYVDGTGARVGGGADVQVSRTPAGVLAGDPSVQWTGQELGVAWLDARDGARQVYFNRVTCK
jgi:hypothetical protein